MDTIAASAITKGDLHQVVGSIEQIARTLEQTGHSGRKPPARQADGASAAHTLTQTTIAATTTPFQTEEQGNKRKKVSPPQSEQHLHLFRVTGDENTKLGFMAGACSPMIQIFQRLVPTEHQTNYMSTAATLQSFHRLFGEDICYARKMLNFMQFPATGGWRCARQVAKGNIFSSEVQVDGTCSHCICDCLQIVQLNNKRPMYYYSFRLMPVKVIENTNPK